MSFEESIRELEAIVGRLDGDDLPLDEALRLFERGVEQLRAASTELARAEAQVRQLVEHADGTFALADVDG
jgi:exodeoxyribonuclease VII small subunit